jgi:hypothetical protein
MRGLRGVLATAVPTAVSVVPQPDIPASEMSA